MLGARHFADMELTAHFYLRHNVVSANANVTVKMAVVVAITLIPKPDKDHLLIENWRPITLMNMDYKSILLVYARRLKKDLEGIIAETQTGFMSNCHIISNRRLLLDLLRPTHSAVTATQSNQ